jgi:hypothetical protein
MIAKKKSWFTGCSAPWTAFSGHNINKRQRRLERARERQLELEVLWTGLPYSYPNQTTDASYYQDAAHELYRTSD